MLAGLEEPDDGDIRIGGKSVVGLEPKDRDIALVFQSYALYPHLSAHDNIGYPLKVRNLSQAEQEARIDRVAAMLAIGHLLPRRPGQLSGGEQQRVALARAIVREPRVFLMDEPLSNLDAKLRVHTRTELKTLQRELGTTMVFVTHDQAEAMSLAHRIAVLSAGELQQLGTPGRGLRPAGQRLRRGVHRQPADEPHARDAAGRLGRHVRAAGGSRCRRASPSPAGELTVGLRPEGIEIVADGTAGRAAGRGGRGRAVRQRGHRRRAGSATSRSRSGPAPDVRPAPGSSDRAAGGPGCRPAVRSSDGHRAVVTRSAATASGTAEIVLEGSFGAADRMRYVLVPFERPGRRPTARGALRVQRSDRFRSAASAAATPSTSACSTRVGPRPAASASAAGAAATRTRSSWARTGRLRRTRRVRCRPGRGTCCSGRTRSDRAAASTGWRSAWTRARAAGARPGPDRLPVRPSLPPARAGWLRGDLHCHTRYSDGDSWPAEMLHAAAEAGLDFLGVTDHNNVAHHAEYGPGGGQYCRSSSRASRSPPTAGTGMPGAPIAGGSSASRPVRRSARAMAGAVEAGAVVSVNHPKPFGPAWEYDTVGPAHAIEVWNGAWLGLNIASLEFWDARLRAGQRLVAVGGSDTHVLRGTDPDVASRADARLPDDMGRRGILLRSPVGTRRGRDPRRDPRRADVRLGFAGRAAALPRSHGRRSHDNRCATAPGLPCISSPIAGSWRQPRSIRPPGPRRSPFRRTSGTFELSCWERAARCGP